MHPDVAYILEQAASDLKALGEDDGLVEVIEFLTALLDKADGHFADGINDAIAAVQSERCSWGSTWLSDPDEYRSRTANLKDPGFDPTALIAALDDIRGQHRPGGYARAITAIRTARDNADGPETPDLDDYDQDDDGWRDEYDEAVEEAQNQNNYLAGLVHAANQTVEHTGVDPDPDWEPA